MSQSRFAPMHPLLDEAPSSQQNQGANLQPQAHSRRLFLQGAAALASGIVGTFGLPGGAAAQWGRYYYEEEADPYRYQRPRYDYGPPRRREPEPQPFAEPEPEPTYRPTGEHSVLYGPVRGEPFPVPAAPLSRINPRFLRQQVPSPFQASQGTIVIDPRAHFLYAIGSGGRAMRYGVGVGRQGFSWSGTAEIRDKQEWPDWYPPKEMIARQPEIRRVVTELQGGLGVPGGPRNPLGARALYLWQNGKDTLYRIHGTVEPWTIGSNVSSGCIRMINQDVIDLYDRTPLGAKVVVLS